MTARSDLLALSADVTAHLERVAREVADIEGLAPDGIPDRTVLWALAGHLQAHYTGCEAILRRIVERFEGGSWEGSDGHVRLLRCSAVEVPGLRPCILAPQTVLALDAHRAFRHFFRHGYGVELDWQRLEPLVRGIAAVHADFVRDVHEFQAFLGAAADAD